MADHPEHRIALRPDHRGCLDDVVVTDVEMFRAEDMGDFWWLCCYLPGGDRITWHMTKSRGRIEMTTIEYPMGVAYEEGSIAPPHAASEVSGTPGGENQCRRCGGQLVRDGVAMLCPACFITIERPTEETNP